VDHGRVVDSPMFGGANGVRLTTSAGAPKRRRSTARLLVPASAVAGYRFPREAILLAMRWYLRYHLSYRDLEELLAERSIVVDHVTLYRWVTRFTPLLIDAAQFTRHAPGDR